MEHVVRGKLKLKAGSKLKVSEKSKKKKSRKEKKKQQHASERGDGGERDGATEQVVLVESGMTPAQQRYDELRKKREQEEIEKLAGKTYRERVEELNQYLGRLTEHHDVPRVSAAGNG